MTSPDQASSAYQPPAIAVPNGALGSQIGQPRAVAPASHLRRSYPGDPAMGQQIALQMQAQSTYDDAKKSKGVAFLLWFFLGAFGGHRWYLGHTGVALGMLLTLGGLGFWAFFDVFFVSSRVDRVNRAIKERVFAMHGVPLLPA